MKMPTMGRASLGLLEEPPRDVEVGGGVWMVGVPVEGTPIEPVGFGVTVLVGVGVGEGDCDVGVGVAVLDGVGVGVSDGVALGVGLHDGVGLGW